MSRRLAASAVTAAVLLVACGGGTRPAAAPSLPPLHPVVDAYPAATVTLTDGTRRVEVVVRVADTPERRQHGLMQVRELPPGVGMLFVFEGERSGGFWMKDTLIPLDIAFVGADRRIRTILSMQPCRADPCPIYDPGHPYRWALEVAAGWFTAEGVEAGWRMLAP